jgi:hypothetical protein
VEDGTNVEQLDKMETFWLSETLSTSSAVSHLRNGHGLFETGGLRLCRLTEYLYLLFSDDQTIALQDHVFNTEVSLSNARERESD